MIIEILWKSAVPHEKRISGVFIQKLINKMMSRMCFGYYRYEKQPSAGNTIKHRKGIKRLEEKLASYRLTGNTELLIDIANYAMIEFMAPSHPSPVYMDADQGAVVRSMQYWRERCDGKGPVEE